MEPLPKHDEKIVREMKRFSLPKPSSDLRERVIGAAHDAWPAPAPRSGVWRRPLIRLALVAAASVAVIGLAHLISQGMLGPWQKQEKPVIQSEIVNPLRAGSDTVTGGSRSRQEVPEKKPEEIKPPPKPKKLPPPPVPPPSSAAPMLFSVPGSLPA